MGLPVNAAERTIKKNIQNFEVFLSIGQQPKPQETDFEFLGVLNRDSSTLSETIRKIEAPKDRINYSLFWFSKVTEADNEAFSDLKANEVDEAIEKWESTISNNQINENNFTSYKNLGLLYYYKSFQNGVVDLKSLRKSITLYGKSFNSEEFWELYISHFNNSILLNAGNRNDTLSYLFRTIFNEIQEKYNIEEDVEFVKTLINHKQIPDEFREEIVSSLVYDKIKSIEFNVEECNTLCNSNKSQSYDFGNNLYNNIKDSIFFIKNILGENDYRFQMLSDKIADEFLNCAITTFKNNFDERYTNTKVETLFNYAGEYAIGDITKRRVRENETAFNEAVNLSSNDSIISEFFEKLEESNRKLDNLINPYTVYFDFLVVLKYTLSKVDINIKDEYRSMILNLSASLFRNCAVNLSNNLKDYIRAKEILEKSLEYVKDSSIKMKILDDLEIINNNIKISLTGYPYKSTNNSSTDSTSSDSKSNWIWGIIFGIILLVGIISANSKSCKSENKIDKYKNSSSNSNSSNNSQNNTSTTSSNKTTNTTQSNSTKEEVKNDTPPDLKVTRLKTGATPYNSYFSSIRSDKGSYCRLTLINETEEDALISLVRNTTDKVIRCVYVRSNDKYTLKNVPTGKYYMKVYKGTAWSNEKTFKSNQIKGGFKFHEDFAKFNTAVDIEQYKTSKGLSYSSGDWTLYTITTTSSYGFNSSTSSDFFND
ncbi:MAG: hypothetical protein NTY74_02995 [Ignavibacteriae bacterium]|nr:hypothetical protein [Ignavibacteriota bacterium]